MTRPANPGGQQAEPILRVYRPTRDRVNMLARHMSNKFGRTINAWEVVAALVEIGESDEDAVAKRIEDGVSV